MTLERKVEMTYSRRLGAFVVLIAFNIVVFLALHVTFYSSSRAHFLTQKRGHLIGRVNSRLALERVTHTNSTTFVVLGREREYRQGDVLTAVIQARDAGGRPKTYGGDFFRAKLVSVRPREASSAGHVTDHGNGTYTVQFPLYFVGGVKVSIELVHPSEAVKILRCIREVPAKRGYECIFIDFQRGTREERPCFTSQPPGRPPHQLCDLSRKEANGTWFCERPDSLPCSAIAACRRNVTEKGKGSSTRLDVASEDEMKLFRKPYVESEPLKQDSPRPIDVKESVSPIFHSLPACPAIAVNKELNVAVHYRSHGLPVLGSQWMNISRIRYVVDEVDSIHGGPNTVIVLGLWAHFTAEPLEMFRARLYAIQNAIRRLLQRSPGTRVFVRTGTTREHKGMSFYLRGSDWLAYQITQEIRKIFGPDRSVVVLDTWDMSVCQWEADDVHPGPAMVDSQMNMLLSHICPE
ncbi:NXPE family member 3-like [Branchiostoma floridae]|uniref:NXPE family member 3-like n=1 Tax=Branchiostoma floridae TaxID=7739 RepID=A0A9J7N604_BRAFL|nr:NXPE family member 3-like [Branchiostoma floridae]